MKQKGTQTYLLQSLDLILSIKNPQQFEYEISS
jgi:hypothetical protein